LWCLGHQARRSVFLLYYGTCPAGSGTSLRALTGSRWQSVICITLCSPALSTLVDCWSPHRSLRCRPCGSLGLSLAFRIATGPLVALIEWSAIIGLVLSLRRDLEHLHPAFVSRVENGHSLERLEGEETDAGNMTLGHSKLSATSREALTPADAAGDTHDGDDDDGHGEGDEDDHDDDDGGGDDFEDDDVHEIGELAATRTVRAQSGSRHVVIAEGGEGGGVVLGSSPSEHTPAAPRKKSEKVSRGLASKTQT
jgi:hypothetical protein